MPEAESSPLARPRILVRKVQTQRRIRISKSDAAGINWMKPNSSFSVSCFGRIGSAGQLQIFQSEPQRNAFRTINDSLEKFPPTSSEASASWLEFARFAASVWEIQVKYESDYTRFTFVLPKEAYDLKIVPNEHESVTIFIVGDTLEIWKSEKWVEHVANVSARLEHYSALALEAIENRPVDGSDEK